MHFNNDEDELFDDISSEWKVSRIKCLSIFVLQFFALGIDQYVTSNTMPSYIKFAGTGLDPQLSLTLLYASFTVACIVFQIILARYADQTRRIKRLILCCNFCSFVGNVAYSVPYGILILLIGRFMRGIGSAIYAVIIGEVMRSYVPRDLYRAISMCNVGSVIGILLGPAMSSSLKNVNYTILTWQIRHENAFSLATALFFLLIFVLAAALVSDLSMDFDLKANYEALLVRQRKTKQETRVSADSDSVSDLEDFRGSQQLLESAAKEGQTTSSENTWKIISVLGRNPVTLAIFWASFVYIHTSGLYKSQSLDLGHVKVGIENRYDSVIETLCILATGVTFLVVGSLGDRVGNVSWIYGGYALTILCGVCWLLMDFLVSDNGALLSLFVIYLAALSISQCAAISLQVLVGRLVPSNIQCFTEAFRLVFVMLGGSVAGLFYNVELSIPLLSAPLIAAVNVVTIAVVNMNYQYLADPKPLVQISSRKYY